MSEVLASVKALIFFQDKYLVVKELINQNGVWDLPGGKIEYGETPYEALTREIMEETCLSVNIKQSVGVWWFYSKTHSDRQIICHTFLCELIGEPIIDLTKNPAQEEIVEYHWMTKQDLLELELEESLKEIIRNLPS